jgi:hypothetical protein
MACKLLIVFTVALAIFALSPNLGWAQGRGGGFHGGGFHGGGFHGGFNRVFGFRGAGWGRGPGWGWWGWGWPAAGWGWGPG